MPISMRAVRRVSLACLIFVAAAVALRADASRAPDTVTTDGGRYFGPLEDGKLHGRGRLEWDHGNRSEGEFVHGELIGSRRMTPKNRMDLRNVPAKELGALKDDRTLVITAARHDRRSFGCADDNDFTYFGRAFFKEALPGSQSFDEAFGKAEVLVKEWESKDLKGEDGKEDNSADGHSHPQIHNPPAIRDHLRRWRAQIPAPAASASARY